MIQNYILGGYTRRVNDGLYSIEFNPETMAFGDRQLIATLNSPTYVALTPENDYLFAIHGEDNLGGIVTFHKTSEDQWEEHSRLLIEGATGCHVSYRQKSQTIYVSNYHEGRIDVFKHYDDKLEHLQQVNHEGSSVHPNQDASHVHYAGLNQNEDLLFVCDLGSDTLSTYQVDSKGLLTLNDSLDLPAGTGPRHFVLNDEETFGYVNGELNSTTHVISVSDSGQLELTQTVTNIPDEYIEGAAGAAIRLSSDNRFLYVSSRFYDAITVFSIDQENGTLQKIQEVGSIGKIPRDFILDETERFVLVPHQDSDHISVFTRDHETGELLFKNNATYAPECVCIASYN